MSRIALDKVLKERANDVRLPDDSLTTALRGYYKEEDIKRHAMTLLEILALKMPCNYCPKTDPYEHNRLCALCRQFIGLSPDTDCPCFWLGPNECIKRTWLALEQHGFLEEEG